jgi:hypothetical protein
MADEPRVLPKNYLRPLKLSRYPRFFAATLAALRFYLGIPFLDSWIPDSIFQIGV